MDVDNIEHGADFVQALEDIVSACDVLIAVIGNRWLTSSDRSGRRRLDNPEDLARLEVATALKRGIRVVPVLVEGAKIPEGGELPDDLKSLVRRHALEIGHDRFNSDSERLITAVERALGEAIEQQSKLETNEQVDPGLRGGREQKPLRMEPGATEARERLEADDRRKEERGRIPDPSPFPSSSWPARSGSPGERKLRRVVAVMVPMIVVVGLAVVAAIYLGSHPTKVTEPRAVAVQSDLKPAQEPAAPVPSPSISSQLDSKQKGSRSVLTTATSKRCAPRGSVHLVIRSEESGTVQAVG